MSPERQRIAIAEACGWKRVNYYNFNRFLWVNGTDERAEDGLPDYLNDLNAMHEAEKIIEVKADEYMAHLRKVTSCSGPIVWRDYQTCVATAAQRAEAFLRTIGKWEDA